MSDMTMLRIWILVAGIVLVAAILIFGRPKKAGQGRRVARGEDARAEPTLGQQLESELAMGDGAGAPVQEPLDLPGVEAPPAQSELGRRTTEEFDKIVTLYLAAKAGQALHGPDIVVAAERAGLVYGHMGVFHRLVDGHPERGPVFSVANIMKPGSFDMASIHELQTPAIAFFLTLPAPLSALDAWDTMLPTAERMAELLDGVVLDEQRNVIARQRVAHIRDELRAYDRQRQAPPLTRPGRW
ncbi:cell division protein ZipA [Lysobacter sp. N42]|uniref:cell division protein ZipA n=1 Tax=Lysobacter sp. N42 TaxID=2545719 RepID=UPI001046A6DA|nr:cell division protein ZipA [Lysobacter sp. N42]TCZ88330.1 cell division protein ZipA [Lysobacter sp. N42]